MRTRTALAAALFGAVLAAGCSAGADTAKVETTPQVPRIIVVVEENHSYTQVIDSGDAPAISRMAGAGTLLTSYYAIAHPSLPNYIALLSGSTQGIRSDCQTCTNIDAPTLIDQLDKAGISWRGYMQGLPAACSTAATSGQYARRHDPFMYFPAIRTDEKLCRNIVPFDQFSSDLASGNLPQFVWITPDLETDMHGPPGVRPGSPTDIQLVQKADSFLGALYDRLMTSAAWTQDTRLVVTWDEGLRREGNQQETCCDGLATGGHIATVVVGPDVAHGTDAATYTHYSLLRSIETAYGLAHLGHAADPTTRDIPALAAR